MKISIYTDGACKGNPGVGGYAAVICYSKDGVDKQKKVVGREILTTNNRMELMAVIKSVEAISNSKAFKDILKQIRVDIYSDSAYVVNSIKQDWLSKWKHNNWNTTTKGTPVVNRDLWEQFDSLSKLFKNINLIKVKGHSGHEFNELVNDLAQREAIQLFEELSSKVLS